MAFSDYPILRYRGNFDLERVIDYSGVNLSTKYPNGYREDVIIGIELRNWGLTYSALTETGMVTVSDGVQLSRREYIESFLHTSKINGNAPFIINDPVDRKNYLSIFSEDVLKYSVTMTHQLLSSTGLKIEQVYVTGETFNSDGSFGTPEDVD